MDSEAGFQRQTSEEYEARKSHASELEHCNDVYSFFTFVVPFKSVQQERDTGTPRSPSPNSAHSEWHRVIAYGLVVLAVFMQGVVLYAIFKEVVGKSISWQNGIVTVGDTAWSLFAPPSKCRDSSAMCTVVDGVYTCAPPSVQLTSRWDELDTDKDGIWTFKEAEEAQEDLQCKYGVDPVEVFRSFVKILHTRNDMIWIHPDVVADQTGGIHEAYFQYLIGDVAMCVYRTVDMCPNLLERGFFDTALKKGTSPRVGNTTTSALQYCRSLLEEGGTCEKMLPSTYTVWKSESEEQCMDVDYDRFEYTNPRSKMTTSLLAADYKARQIYATFQSPLFMVYKSIIVFVWLLTMLAEVRYILRVFEWIRGFPVGERHEMDDSMEEILTMRWRHYSSVVVLFVLRLIICVFLIWIGTAFLMKSESYVDQLFDAVAMVFVLQFAQLLYDNGINRGLKEEVENLKPMQYKFNPILRGTQTKLDIFWICALVVATVVVMAHNHYQVVLPVYDALGCTCLQTGSHCHEAKALSHDFWQNYWGKTVPTVFTEIDKLKMGANSVESAKAFGPAAAPAAAPTAAVPAQAHNPVNFAAHLVKPVRHQRARHHVRHRHHREAYTEDVKRLHR